MKPLSLNLYYDIEYIREHEDELMRDLVVKTVPHIVNKALSRLDQANAEAWTIIEDRENTNQRDRIAALAVVDKTARNIVDIITNNRSVVDSALGNNKTIIKEGESQEENELSAEATGTTESNDPNAVF